MNSCFLLEPAVEVVYIHVPGDAEHDGFARRFVGSYLAFPPDEPHTTTVVCNGGEPSPEMRSLFGGLPRARFMVRVPEDGWDIGGYIDSSRSSAAVMSVYFAGHAHFKRGGWLSMMRRSWDKNGPGYYGTVATYEVAPHLNTTGIWCSPRLMERYPIRVVDKAQRYDFEHGANAMWRMAVSAAIKVRCCLWDGNSYEWRLWRQPPNIYRRGDQSNCLAMFRHTEVFDRADPETRNRLSRLADSLTDMTFLRMKPNRRA